MNKKEIKEELGRLYDCAQKVVSDSEARGEKTMNADDNARFEGFISEHTELEKKLGQLERLEGINKQEVENVEQIAERKGETADQVRDFKEASRTAFESYLRGGVKGMTANELQVMKRAQSAGTDSEGGYTVDETMSSAIIKAMAQYGGVREAATILSTSTGAPLQYPTNNDTANVGEWLSENSAASAQDTVFGNVTLNGWKASSDYMLLSRELIQDSAFNIEAYITELIAERIGRLTNTAYTTGAGSTTPHGIVTAATAGAVTDAAGVLDFDDLLDLKHSVDRAYRTNGKFMFNDTTLKALKKAAIASANQSLWQPGIVGGAPATIDGDEYIVNNDMADVATNSHSAIYGDFSKFLIRDVTGVEVLRSDQLNMLSNQVTYVGFMRTDSALLDTGAVKYIRTVGT
jgi:HK97 family phage major capsid protein